MHVLGLRNRRRFIDFSDISKTFANPHVFAMLMKLTFCWCSTTIK
jgi:hypothetical protein